MHEGNRGRHRGSTDPEAEFINPNYFRMLNNSLPSSASSSRPSSPRRRLVRPALPDGPTSEPSSGPAPNQGQGISSSAFSPDYFKRFFVEEKVLGKGGKGVVLLVKHVLDGVSLGHFACKRVPVGDDHEWLEKVLGEVQLLQNLSHQNLVSYRHVWLENARISTFGPSVPCAFIIQQYCNAGDLHNYICGGVQTTTTAQQLKDRLRRKSKGEPELKPEMGGPRVLQLDEIYSFFRDITAGLRHLHMNGYIHRDLKPNNCLLHETSDGIRVLVSDFGEVQSQNAMRKSTGATGTVSYCAPEVLRQEYPDGPFGNFTFKSDIFSLGMILYFLCFGELPYHSADIINEDNEDLDQLRDEITHWTGFDNARRRRPDLPAKLYSFLDQLLSVDPDRRPTADDVLNGIQAANNASENFRFKRNNSASPDLPGAARIRTVDSPVPPPSMERALSPIKKKIARSPVSMRRDSMFDSSSGPSGTPASETVLENRTSLSPDKDLVMRQRYSTSSPNSSTRQIQPHEEPMDLSAPPITHTRQLLPPPPPTSSTFMSRLGASTLFPGLQVSLFLVKVVTVLHPCSPVAVRPWFLYPLLLLAAITLRAHDLRVQALSTLAHVLLVGLGMQLGVLCTWHGEYAMGV
jgi:serine/threonine protein kinase